MSIQDEIDAERRASMIFDRFLADHGNDLRAVAHWGDGEGGWLIAKLKAAVGIEDRVPTRYTAKAAISRSLSKRVFERDAYRCRHCDSHVDLTCDHVIPESAGGETTAENLQTLCRPCNSRKGVRQ